MAKSIQQGDVTINRNDYETPDITGTIKFNPSNPDILIVNLRLTNPTVNLCSLDKFTEDANSVWLDLIETNIRLFSSESKSDEFVPLSSAAMKELLDL